MCFASAQVLFSSHRADSFNLHIRLGKHNRTFTNTTPFLQPSLSIILPDPHRGRTLVAGRPEKKEMRDLMDSMLCLRVTLNSQRNFDVHLDSISAKTCLTLRILCILNLCFPVQIKDKIVLAFRMSHANYCIKVISDCSSYNVERFKVIVNRPTPRHLGEWLCILPHLYRR